MIFGHNMKNLSAKPLIIAKDHSRFEQLLSFYYQSFISSHQFILLSTKNDNYIYKIFAVTFRKNDSILLTNPKNDQEMQALIDESLDNSLFKIDTKIDTDDKVLALITCTRILGARSDIRFMVLAKRVTSNKDLYYSTVKINKLKNMGIKE